MARIPRSRILAHTLCALAMGVIVGTILLLPLYGLLVIAIPIGAALFGFPLLLIAVAVPLVLTRAIYGNLLFSCCIAPLIASVLWLYPHYLFMEVSGMSFMEVLADERYWAFFVPVPFCTMVASVIYYLTGRALIAEYSRS